MAEHIISLRQQVAAAEFLAQSLRTQLHEAEQKAARQQREIPGNVPQQSVNSGPRIIAAPATEQNGNLGADSSGTGPTIYERTLPVGSAADADDATVDQQGQSVNGPPEEEADDDAPGETINEIAPGFELPSLEVGLIYPSIEEVKRAVIAHAISQGWTSSVHKRDRSRLVIRCRSAKDCPYHLRAEAHELGAKIVSWKPDHSCSFQSDQSHVPRGPVTKLKFLREQLPTFLTVDEKTTAQEIFEAIYQRFGTKVSMKQCRELRMAPKRQRKYVIGACSKCGALGHNRLTCGRRTEGTP